MIKNYLKERRSWIMLFLGNQCLILFITYLDWTIPFLPVLYIVLLSSLIFFIFLVVRYYQETKFYKSLDQWDNDLDLSKLIEAQTPFEKMLKQNLINQTEKQKQIAEINMTALEQEKDDLLAWIHEVKTPLTAMHLMIERINDQKLKSQLSFEWLRIHFLLDQQLHEKRMLFIENDLYIESISLQPIIFKEIKALQAWCMQKGIGFDVELEVAMVLSDAKWLSFIIRQLLTNAVKYSDSSDIIIKSFETNGRACIEVEDFGRGIAPKDLPRIFDKGFTTTIAPTLHEGSTATGMGLYLAKKAAEPLQIQIEAKSELEKGSKFTLTFSKKNEFVSITSV